MPNRTAKTQVLAGGATNDYDLTANNEVLRRTEFAPILTDIGTLPNFCDPAQLAQRASFWFGPADTVATLDVSLSFSFSNLAVPNRYSYANPTITNW